MTTYSLSDLAAKSLRQPGLYAVDETIPADELEDAEESITSLTDALADEGIAIVNGSVNAVPSSWYLALARYCGLFLLESYGGGAPTPDQVIAAELPLRRLSA